VKTVELFHNQTAEPNRCGSCHYFDRRDGGWDTHGLCLFRLPPTRVYHQLEHTMPEDEVDRRTVRDTDGCDLYRAMAGKFQKMRTWQAGE
jgi:hypothetical protein